MFLPPGLLSLLCITLNSLPNHLFSHFSKKFNRASICDGFVDLIHITAQGCSGKFGFLYQSLFSSPYHSRSINKSLPPCLILATMPTPGPLGFSPSTSKGLLKYFLQMYIVFLQEEFWRMSSPFIA